MDFRKVGLLCIAIIGATVIHSKVGAQVVEFSNSDLSLFESDGNVSVCVEVTQGDIISNEVVLLTSSSDFAISGTDYIPFDREALVFTPDGPKTLCMPFSVRVDGVLESSEVVTISLTAASSSSVTIGSRSSLTINILDSDRVTLGFEQSSYTVREGDGRIDVCAIRLSGTVDRELILTMSVLPQAMSAGNASNELDSLDYTVEIEEVTLNSGSTRACAQFGSVDDNTDPILEELEFYQIRLSTVDTADIEPSRSITNFFIEDNDGATVTIETTTFSLPEGNNGSFTPIQICLRLTDTQSGLMRNLFYTVTLNFGTADTNDITPPGEQSLMFPSSSTVGESQCVTYEIVGDDFKEIDDTLTATLVRGKSDDIINNPSPDVAITIEDDGDLVQFCEGLTAPDNGNIRLTGTIEMSTATYECDQGYILVGDNNRICQRDVANIPGQWSGSQPICRIANCGQPPMPSGITQVSFTNTVYLSEATYSCSDGCYQLVPDVTQLICQENETWSPSSAPTCIITDCGQSPEYTNCTAVRSGTTCGSTANYSPRDSDTIRIFGDTELVCGSNGMWLANMVEGFPFCIPRGICPKPPTPISNGCLVPISIPSFDSLEENAVANYSCPDGCTLSPRNATSRTCTNFNVTNGFWSGDTPACEGVTCDEVLTAPENGTVDNTMRLFMDNAIYGCNPGYMISGNAVRTCQANGTWSGVDPSCIPVECPNLNLTNGNVSVTGINPGQTATYSCDEGYTLVGDNTTTCMLDGSWSGTEPVCYLDCGNDTEVMTFEVTRNTESLTHGTITTHTCVRDSCPFDRTCFNGMWNGTLPSCEVPRCRSLRSSNKTLNITHPMNPVYNSIATYICTDGIDGDINTRTCKCDGEWTDPTPVCNPGPQDGLSTGAIIGIAIAAAVILIVLLILLICCIAYCVRSRRNYDKQLDNAYREFMRPYNPPYNTTNAPAVVTPQAHPEPPHQMEEMEKEILRSQDNLIEDDDDDLPSPTPSDEDMDEYRLRMRDVETQSTGSQHRIKPRIVAEKVEVEI